MTNDNDLNQYKQELSTIAKLFPVGSPGNILFDILGLELKEPVSVHSCMDEKPHSGQGIQSFVCSCGNRWRLANEFPGNYWEEVG